MFGFFIASKENLELKKNNDLSHDSLLNWSFILSRPDCIAITSASKFEQRSPQGSDISSPVPSGNSILTP